MTANYFAEKALRAAGFENIPISSDQMRRLMEKRNWVFESFGNGEQSRDLLRQLDLEKMAKKCKVFSYKLGNKKIVFYHESLLESDRAFGFVHEYGHDLLKHFSLCGVLGFNEAGIKDEKQEEEANKFAAYFMAPPCVLRKAKIYSAHAIRKATLIPEDKLPYVYANLHIRENADDFTQREINMCNQFYTVWAGPANQKLIRLMRKMRVAYSGAVDRLRTGKRALAKHHKKILDGRIVPDNYDPLTMVLVTDGGKSYHDMYCTGARRINLIAMTVPEAISKGYHPCSRCRKQDISLETIKQIFTDQQIDEIGAFTRTVHQAVKMTKVKYDFICPICGHNAVASRNQWDGSYIAKCNHCHTSIRL